MIFEYFKSKKVGPIKQGMTREEVRKFFNTPIIEFKKTYLSKVTTDDFPEIDVHAFYNPTTNTLAGIEIFQPNRLFYKDEAVILARDQEYLLIVLKENKIPYDLECLGIVLEDGNIKIYVPHNDERHPECASVYVDLIHGGSLSIQSETVLQEMPGVPILPSQKIENNKDWIEKTASQDSVNHGEGSYGDEGDDDTNLLPYIQTLIAEHEKEKQKKLKDNK